MKTANNKKRFSLSIVISVIIHLLFLIYIVFYVATHPPQPPQTVIQANLVDISSSSDVVQSTVLEGSRENKHPTVSQISQAKKSAAQSKVSESQAKSKVIASTPTVKKKILAQTKAVQTNKKSVINSSATKILSSSHSTSRQAVTPQPSLNSIMNSNVNESALNGVSSGTNTHSKVQGNSNYSTNYQLKAGSLYKQNSNTGAVYSSSGSVNGKLATSSSSSAGKLYNSSSSDTGVGLNSAGTQIGSKNGANGLNMQVVGGGSAIWDPNNKMPHYPREAEKNSVQGSVGLIMTVNANGQVIGVIVKKNSGDSSLDSAAMNAATNWKIFIVRNGSYIPGKVQITIQFKLK
ncbi:MAG: TonB family protein [Fusobacteria bacterium]|nr:TonB family protein [Fusobacteriota bacterium]